MRIVSIELNGFKRMNLNGIKRFKLTPTARVQLILGANGSGKSSLVSELTPLPADKANYTKDGSKIIVIESKGIIYTLTNDFSSSNHQHSLMRGDEELNDGGTITVQKELVNSIFGITQEKHDICTGVERFTQMSPARKREVLTDLCDSDFDYALRVFAKAREAQRDTSGALKLAKKRLVTETAKLVSKENVEQVENEAKKIIHDIDLLYRNRTQDIRTPNEIEYERQELEESITAFSNQILNYKYSGATFLLPQEIESDIESIRLEISATSAKIEVATKDYQELKKSHDVFLKTGNADANTLKTQIDELKTKQKDLLALRKLGLEFTDAYAAKAAYEAAEMVNVILTEIPENKDRTFSQKNLQEARDKVANIKLQITKFDTSLDQLRHRKSHFDNLINSGETECPKCNHRWVLGYNKKDHEDTIATIGILIDGREKALTELKETEQKVIDNEQYGIVITDFMRIVRATPALNPFWDYLREEEMVYNYPRQAYSKFTQLETDLKFSCEAVDIQKEIDRLKDLHELAIKASDMTVAAVTEKLQAVESLLGQLTANLTRCQTRYQNSRTLLAKTKEFVENGRVLDVKVDRLKECSMEVLVSIRNDIINNALGELQIELAKRQNLLNDFRLQQGIVDDIQKSVKDLERQEQVYKLIVNELSPTDGLIAEGLLGFIRIFVKKMNLIIKKIWTYRLEVQDCSVGDGETAELDYKFPLLVGEENNVSPDVSKTSRGQQEVVDLAFRIVATSYYGLNDCPLFLDEFSSSFDTEHRSTAVFAVQQILEQLPFSQMFMVSHYNEQFGAFKNAQVCSLTRNGIVQSERFNEHVEMA